MAPEHFGAAPLGVARQFLQQAGFAHAGFPLEQDETTGAGERRFDVAQQQRALVRPSDEGQVVTRSERDGWLRAGRCRNVRSIFAGADSKLPRERPRRPGRRHAELLVQQSAAALELLQGFVGATEQVVEAHHLAMGLFVQRRCVHQRERRLQRLFVGAGRFFQREKLLQDL